MKVISTTENKPWKEGACFSDNFDAEILLKDKTGQEIDGFGGCFNELGMIALRTLEKEEQAVVLDELFCKDGCAFNYCRTSMGANDFSESWYSYNEAEGDYDMLHFSVKRDDRHVIPFIKEAYKRNDSIKLFASPWSPPTWMKYPKAYNHGTLVKTEENLKAYALYFKKYLEEYRKRGITIDAVHVQNEFISSQKFPSCVWRAEELEKFIVDYLVKSIGDQCEIWFGTVNGPETDHRQLYTRYNDYLNYAMQNPKFREIIKGVGYQWAGKFAVQQTHDDYPNLKIIQSESECGDGSNTWEYAMYIFEMIRHYFRNGASAYVYWNMILFNGGESTWGWHQNSMITVKDGRAVFNPEFYLMKHFSHFVKRGALLLQTEGAWSSNTLAFVNPDGEKVIVTCNPFMKEKSINILDKNYLLPARSFTTIVL